MSNNAKVASISLCLQLTNQLKHTRLTNSASYRKWSQTLRLCLEDVKTSTANNAASCWSHTMEAAGANTSAASQRFCLFLILNTCDEINESLINELPTTSAAAYTANAASTAWNHLRDTHISNMASNRDRLQKAMSNLRMSQFRGRSTSEEDSIDAYVSALRKLRYEYVQCQGTSSEQDLFHLVRAQLPSQYKQVVISSGAWSAEEASVTRLVAYLKNVCQFVTKEERADHQQVLLHQRGNSGNNRWRDRPHRGRQGRGSGQHHHGHTRGRGRGRQRTNYNSSNSYRPQHNRNRNNEQQQPCFNFSRGTCNRGDRCKYRHDSASLLTEHMVLCTSSRTTTDLWHECGEEPTALGDALSAALVADLAAINIVRRRRPPSD